MDVVPAELDRLDGYADLFARTFSDDLMITWPLRSDDPQAMTRGYWMAFGTEVVAAGWTWEAPPLVGFATWVPPGDAERFIEVDKGSREAIAALTDDRGARNDRMWDWIERHLPDEPHWYLDHIAVSPERQGQGHGSALIRWGLERAVRDGTCAFLETGRERNVALYEHFGFRVVEAATPPGGGPTIWFMRWDQA